VIAEIDDQPPPFLAEKIRKGLEDGAKRVVLEGDAFELMDRAVRVEIGRVFFGEKIDEISIDDERDFIAGILVCKQPDESRQLDARAENLKSRRPAKVEIGNDVEPVDVVDRLHGSLLHDQSPRGQADFARLAARLQ
jgi:hypothetical protein